MLMSATVGLAQRVFIVLAFVAVCLVTAARAQYTGVTTSCGVLYFTPSELEGNHTMYFTAVANDIMSFEFRLIAGDGKPVGWKELYAVDEDDDSMENYDCFVASSTDDGACGNSYVAAGETMGNYVTRTLKIGFQKCDGWSLLTHSTDLRLEMFYRPTTMVSVLTPVPVCGSLSAVVPTAFCDRENGAVLGGLVASMRGATVLVAMVVLVTVANALLL